MNTPKYPPKGTQAKRKADGLPGRVYVSSPTADLVAVRWSAEDDSGTFLFNAEQFAHEWEWQGAGGPHWKLRAGAIALVVICGIGLYGGLRARRSSLVTSASPADPASQADTPAPSAAPQEDPKAIRDKYGALAAAACSKGADDYLKSAAKFGFQWDATSRPDEKFNEFETFSVAPGITTSSSDKLLLQDRAGALKRVDLLCSYDTKANKVLRYWIADSAE